MWLAWDSCRWQRDATGEAQRAAKDTAHALLARAAAIKGQEEAKAAAKWAITARAEQRIRAQLTLAETELEIAITPDALDADPWLLSCTNGTLDLRTGELREHDPSDLLSLGTDIAYNPDAECPRWEHFLAEVFAEDETLAEADTELIAFVQRLAGYTLTATSASTSSPYCTAPAVTARRRSSRSSSCYWATWPPPQRSTASPARGASRTAQRPCTSSPRAARYRLRVRRRPEAGRGDRQAAHRGRHRRRALSVPRAF